MGALQSYDVTVDWTGADENGTSSYTSYSRDHVVLFEERPTLLATSDRKVEADVARYRAEELFLGSIAQVQMLWFLRTAALRDIVVLSYVDKATATERIESAGSGPFTEVVLRPRVAIKGEVDEAEISAIHDEARERNHLARSLAIPVYVEPFDLERA